MVRSDLVELYSTYETDYLIEELQMLGVEPSKKKAAISQVLSDRGVKQQNIDDEIKVAVDKKMEGKKKLSNSWKLFAFLFVASAVGVSPIGNDSLHKSLMSLLRGPEGERQFQKNALINDGMKYFGQEKFIEAEQVLSQAWSLDKNDPYVNLMLGVSYMKTGVRERGEMHLKTAIEFKKDSLDPFDQDNVAMSFELIGDSVNAKRYAEFALKTFKDRNDSINYEKTQKLLREIESNSAVQGQINH